MGEALSDSLGVDGSNQPPSNIGEGSQSECDGRVNGDRPKLPPLDSTS